MCGIVGLIAKKSKEVFSNAEIRKMANVQKHRGPDDSGIAAINNEIHIAQEITDEEIFIGKSVVAFNRLSIQDLSINGHQPMMNGEKNVILTFNGEIYNFKELRRDLIKRGYEFNSLTDTEVILNLYLEFGIEAMLNKLNGMFAIVLYDLRINQVFIIRDRFGIKPIYFAWTENYFLFSSETKSFLHFHEFKPMLEDDILQEYILFRNVTYGSLLKNVEQILPGQVLQISLENNEIHKRNYFDINRYCRDNEQRKSITEIKNELMDVLSDAVQRQMISDVKVGCQLSGGIDSSLISYIASKKFGMTDTISIVVDDPRFSEENYIDRVNNKLNTNNHKYKLNANYYVDNFVNTVWYFEGITVHASTLGVYQLAEQARKKVTVLLSGEGADELFGGYKCFIELLDNSESLNGYDIIVANGKIADSTAQEIYSKIEIEKQIEKRKSIYNKLDGSKFDKQIKYEMLTYLPELLVRQDKMSMAHSIENRVPFLDNEVVKYAFEIPEYILLNRESKQGKDILKQMCVPIFGEDFAYRKKMGFGMPTNTYLFSNLQFARKIVSNLKKRGIVNGNLMEEWSENITKLRGLDAELFFKIFGFEIWCELFLDKKSVENILE